MRDARCCCWLLLALAGPAAVSARLPTNAPKRIVDLSTRVDKWSDAIGPTFSAKLQWDQELDLWVHNAHLTAHYNSKGHRSYAHGLEDVKLSGSILARSDVAYELTHNFPSKTSGLQLTAAVDPLGRTCTLIADAEASSEGRFSLASVGAFLLAGPVNIAPTFWPETRTLRFKLGRGRVARRCPISASIERPFASGGHTSYEFGMRGELGPGRKLRARLLLGKRPETWVELIDKRTDSDATWIAKAAVPLESIDSFGAARSAVGATKVTLRRAWQF